MTKIKEFISGADLMKMDFPPLTMLTSFLPATAFVVISGMPGSGKTEFLMHQAVEIASKEKVLFFCNEGGPRNFQLRLKAYCKNEASLRNIIYEPKRWPNFGKDSNNENEIDFETIIKRFQPRAIFFDSGPDAFEDENEAQNLKEPLRKLYDLVHRYGICLAFSWHPAKGLMPSSVYNLRGSTTISGKIDMMYDLNLQGQKRVLILHKMRPECTTLKQGQKWAVEMISTGNSKDLRFNDVQEAKEAYEEERRNRLQATLSRFTPGNEYTSTEIHSTLLQSFNGAIKDATAKKHLRQWIKDQQFSLVQEGRGKKPAIYKRVDNELPT